MISQIVKQALNEDHAGFDVTTLAVFSNKKNIQKGDFIAKENLVLSGLDVVKEVFKQVSDKIKIRFFFKDGAFVKKGKKILTVQGSIQDLLKAERVALNFLQQLSGVATTTNQYVQKIKPYHCDILDTRKTIPGLRLLQKKAVVDGGGKNHRMNLEDMYLIKDNHIEACGSVSEAIVKVKEKKEKGASSFKNKKIEVEVKNISELKEAIKVKPDIILLDNMAISQIKKAVQINARQCLLEVSGGVTLKTVKKYAALGVNRISVGALTHSVKSVDISFLIG